MDDSVLTISKNLKALINKKKMSESELARQANIPRATVNRIIAAKSPNIKAENLRKLAKQFNISIDVLMGSQNNASSIPILSHDQASHWEILKEKISQNDHPHWLKTNKNHLFGLKIDDKALSPYVNPGNIVVIDCEKKPKCHDLVAFYDAKQKVTLLRYLNISGTKILFKPVQANFQTLTLSDGDKILGTACQIIIDDTL